MPTVAPSLGWPVLARTVRLDRQGHRSRSRSTSQQIERHTQTSHSELVERDVHRRQGRFDVAARRDVVEPDDRDVGGHDEPEARKPRTNPIAA